ncbi:MAG: M1 family metallopeptidase [Flavobacteriaceae bacterium]
MKLVPTLVQRLILVWLILSGNLFFAQQAHIVDFLNIDATVKPILSEEKVEGSVRVTFKMLQKADSVYLDAIVMKITDQALEGIPVTASEDKIWFLNSFEKDQTYTAFFNYEANPKQALYFVKDQVWTQGQGKYTSHWLPSIDDMNDKIEFDLKIAAPSNKTVIANGELEKFILYDEDVVWQYNMEQPMSSYLVAFAMGDFKMKKLESQSGVPLEMYLSSKDSLKREPTYRYTKEIFDFLETEIGVPYPWQNYKQVAVRDFLYAGMENTGCTIFSEAFVVDSTAFVDRNYVNVNAHELAHQWFGNLVTETEGTHHWLHEGFATYYALLAEKEIFGDDYYYWKLFNSAEQLQAMSDVGKGEALLNPKASSLTFYEKGAWALHILRETIGEEAFKKGVQNYVNKYAYGNVTTDDFLKEITAVTDADISVWKTNWLEQSAFKAEEAYQSLVQSSFMERFFQVSALRATSIQDKKPFLQEAIRSNNEYIAQEAVYQLANEAFSAVKDLYRMAMNSENTIIRQAVALSMDKIPKDFQQEYESLLRDASYLTIEAALYNLWINFPEKRSEFLDTTNHLVGFQDKNIRQLWLTLALYTQGYHDTDKPQYLSELVSYSGDTYSFEIREKALEYLFSMGVKSPDFIKNLVNACTHHYWKFRDGARNMLATFMEEERTMELVLEQYNSFTEKEKAYLKRKIKL